MALYFFASSTILIIGDLMPSIEYKLSKTISLGLFWSEDLRRVSRWSTSLCWKIWHEAPLFFIPWIKEAWLSSSEKISKFFIFLPSVHNVDWFAV